MISFGPTVDNPLFDNIHMQLLKEYDFIGFKHNDDPECAKSLDIPYPSIAFFRKFEPQITYYTGEANLTDFRSWWFEHLTPPIFRLEDYQSVVF
jgi:hypothetical protein